MNTLKNILVAILIIGPLFALSHRIVAAESSPPSEHKGVSVVSLGVLPESSLASQIGLHGYKMQLREITLSPGGQIARHDHFKRPGLVWTLAGSWTEGRPSGESEFPASRLEAILEDKNTEHWFYNNNKKRLRAIVCDIVPAE